MASAQTLINTYAWALCMGVVQEHRTGLIESNPILCNWGQPCKRVKHTRSLNICLVHNIPLSHCKNPLVDQMSIKNEVWPG